MAYLAIARKWRPQRFEDIVGQVHITRTLQNAIRLGRVHHAFLFTGARGVGKTTAARILAKALNCEQGPTPTPCNACRSCKEITAGNAPDVHEIDAASHTGVDSVREIRDNLRYLPSVGKHKIYIIDEVHMLSTAAFNALLKTLEEPPSHVVFIFATTDPQKVPDTILSRCQRFDFKRIAVRSIAGKLAEIASTEGVSVSEASLLMIAREAEGSMRDSQSLLDQVISSSSTEVLDEQVVEILGLIDRRMVFDCLEGVLTKNADRCLEVVDKIHDFGVDMKVFAQELLEVVRHLNVVKVSDQAQRFLDATQEELAILKRLCAPLSQDELSRHFVILAEGYDAIARSDSSRLVLEMTLLRMLQVRPVQPVDGLIRRIGELENLLSGLATASPARAGSATPGLDDSPRGTAPTGGPPFPPAGSRNNGGAIPDRSAVSGERPPFLRGEVRPAAAPRAPASKAAPGPGLDAGDEDSDPDDELSGPMLLKPAVDVSPPGPASRTAAPAPATPAAPAPVPGVSAEAAPSEMGPAGDFADQWVKFVDQWVHQATVEPRPRYLRAAVPIREFPDRLVVGLQNEVAIGGALAEAGSAPVTELLASVLGRRVKVECVVIGSERAGPSYTQWEEAQEKTRRDGIAAQQRAHPTVRMASRIFGVEPADIKVENERIGPRTS